MVSTRNHPTPLPEPVLPTSTTTTLANDTSPSKPPASSRKVRTTVSRRRRSSSTSSDHESKIESPSRSTKSSSSQPNGHLSSSYSPKSSSSSGSSQGQWAHISDPVTLYWLLISLPLVLWDTGYILFRPYTFPGGILHSPLYRPYAKYGVVDLVYSRAAYESGMGFTAAQGTINLVETAGYLGYLYAVWKYGETQGEGNGKAARSLGGTKIGGGWGGVACLCGFGMSLATVSKTVLYFLNEYFSSWSHTGHNDLFTWLVFWVLPNCFWVIVPTYTGYVFARDILRGLSIAGGDQGSSVAIATDAHQVH